MIPSNPSQNASLNDSQDTANMAREPDEINQLINELTRKKDKIDQLVNELVREPEIVQLIGWKRELKSKEIAVKQWDQKVEELSKMWSAEVLKKNVEWLVLNREQWEDMKELWGKKGELIQRLVGDWLELDKKNEEVVKWQEDLSVENINKTIQLMDFRVF
jgi:uncharacterized protein YukE